MDNERLTAWAQIVFSTLLIVLFGTVLLLVLLNPLELAEGQLEIAAGLLDQLVILIGIVAFFWFNRQRSRTDVDRNPPPAPEPTDPPPT